MVWAKWSFLLAEERQDQVHYEQKQSNLYTYKGQYGKQNLAKFPGEELHP